MLRGIFSHRLIVVAVLVLVGLVPARADVRQDCQQEKDHELAIKACSQSLRASPNAAWALYGRAAALIAAGEKLREAISDDADKLFDRAIADLDKAIALEPRLAHAHRARADAYRLKYASDKAMADYAQAISLDPSDFRAFGNRGRIYVERRELDQAVVDFSQAITINPNEAVVRVDRAKVYEQRKNYAGAIADLSKAIELQPDRAELRVRRATLLVKSGKAAQGLPDAEQLVKENPGSAEAWRALGTVLNALGRKPEAGEALRRSVQLDPSDADIRAAYASLKPLLSKPRSAPCAARARPAPDAPPRVKASLRAGQARVGEPVTLAWSVPPLAKDVSKPAYLFVLLPDVVRVDGTGFFALAAGAPNPAGIKFAADRTRAIVPLHTTFAEAAGEIEILPYASGPLSIEWVIVGTDGCQEWIAARDRSEPIGITGGVPRIVLRDEFSAQRPDSVIRALNGPYRVHVFKDRFEVYDDASGELVLRRQGTDPRFSPTGRFLSLMTSVGETYEVLDLLAGRVVGRYEAHALHWSHADSFLWYEDEHASKMQIVRTLHGRRDDLTARVMTRREAKYAKVVAGLVANMDEAPADRKPRPPTVDIEPEGTTCSRGCYAQQHWLLELSLERGLVTFYDTFHMEKPPQILVYDLGAKRENVLFQGDARGIAAYKQMFGVEFPVLDGWDLGDALKTTMIAFADGDDKKRLVATGRSLATAARAVQQKGPEGKPRKLAARHSISRDPRDPGAVASSGIIGAQLDHLPSLTPVALRAGRDGDALRRIEQELVPLLPPAIARLGSKVVAIRYGRAPFPDPSGAAPKEPIEYDLAALGRDLWRWSIDGTTYWLTHAAASDHLMHDFTLTLLAQKGSGKLRHANLIRLANDPNGKHVFKPSGDKDNDEEARRYGTANIVPDGPYDQSAPGDFRGELNDAFGDPSVVAFSGGRYLAVLTKPVARLVIFDVQTWRFVCGVSNPIDGADAVSVVVHASARHVTQVNSDGAVHVYACPSGDNVLNGAYVDDELVVMDRNGYFDGSDDASGYVDVVVPGLPGRHLLSQFSKVLWRPGVAAEVLSGQKLPPPAITAPPALRMAAAQAGAGGIRLDAFSASGLEQVRLFADGRLYKRIDVSGTSSSVTIASSEQAAAGAMTAIAVDRAGLVSAPLALPRTAGQRRPSGRLFVLAVGVDRYPLIAPTCGPDANQSCDLTFAASDAKRVAGAVAKSRLYAGKSVNVLTDEHAHRDAILAELDRMIEQATPADTIMVSFAGHGLIDDKNALQLGLSTTQLEQVQDTALGFDLVSARLRQSKARVLVLLDVCHAGLADRAAIATNDAAVSRLVTDSGASMVILSASKGRQFSEETAKSAGGLFSTTFEQILTSDRAVYDTDGNGAISISELYRGLKSAVVRDSEGRQTPWLSRNLMVGDFDLF
jgi:tetratricopeptide (TPR) repeat protein